MNRTIRQLTDSLTDLLPDDQQYYKLSDLRSWGFPGFIVRRIRVELERNLAESMRLPKTDWANMQSENVQSIWKQFINAIRNEAWLPASYASTVIETAVGDVLEILVEPRNNIADVLYGADKELDLEELEKRVDVLVVYPHFASLLPRYMKKKKLNTLGKERCADIIKKADKKITARYTPLNWAQLLEPLFQLFSEQIDSNLLRLFFEDKKMPRIARKFDFMNDPVDRAKLIETLSAPDSLNLEGYEEDQSDLFSGENEENEPGGKSDSGAFQQSESGDATEMIDESERPGDETPEGSGSETHPADQNAPSHSAQEDPKAEDDRIETESTLNTIFAGEEETESPTTEKPDIEEKETKEEPGFSLNDDFQDGEQGQGGEAEDIKVEKTETEGQTAETGDAPEDFDSAPAQESGSADEGNEQREKTGNDDAGTGTDTDSYTETDTVVEATDEDDIGAATEDDEDSPAFEESAIKETPMWQRFMSEEELDLELDDEGLEAYEERDFESGEETGDELNNTFAFEGDEEGFLDQPIIDLTENQAPDEEEISRLHEILRSERDYFVREIFGGSEQAYDQALQDIAGKKNWRSASRYLESEVFKRNMVDMYSEEAVDLTDRLHTYFLNKADTQ